MEYSEPESKGGSSLHLKTNSRKIEWTKERLKKQHKNVVSKSQTVENYGQ